MTLLLLLFWLPKLPLAVDFKLFDVGLSGGTCWAALGSLLSCQQTETKPAATVLHDNFVPRVKLFAA